MHSGAYILALLIESIANWSRTYRPAKPKTRSYVDKASGSFVLQCKIPPTVYDYENSKPIHLPPRADRRRERILDELEIEFSQRKGLERTTFEQDIDELIVWVFNSRPRSNEIEILTDELLNHYENHDFVHVVFIPLQGLELFDEIIQLERFTITGIHVEDDDSLGRATRFFPAAIKKKILDNIDEFLDSYCSHLSYENEHITYAVTVESGDCWTAENRAFQRFNELLGILHLFDSLACGQSRGCKIDVYPAQGHGGPGIFTVSLDAKTGSFWNPFEEEKRVFRITPRYSAPVSIRLNLDRFLRLRAGNDSFEPSLLSALKWFDLARSSQDPSISFIAYITVIEALFPDTSIANKGNFYCNLISKLIPDFDLGFKYRKQFRKWYGLRNRILHEGLMITGEASRATLGRLEKVVAATLYLKLVASLPSRSTLFSE